MRVMGPRVLIHLEDQSMFVRGVHHLSTPPPATGIAVAFGPGVVDVEVGDRITFQHFAGTSFTVKGQKMKLLDENEILLNLGPDPDHDAAA